MNSRFPQGMSMLTILAVGSATWQNRKSVPPEFVPISTTTFGLFSSSKIKKSKHFFWLLKRPQQMLREVCGIESEVNCLLIVLDFQNIAPEASECGLH